MKNFQKKIIIKKNLDISNSSKISNEDDGPDNKDITDINIINNSNENEIKEIENLNKNEEKISFKNDSNYDKNIYELYKNYFKNYFKNYKNYTKINDEILFEIPNFTLLKRGKIRPFYYANYFIYLYCDKNILLDVTSYQDYINKIKFSKIKRD